MLLLTCSRSAPFSITDLGRVHVKLAKAGQRQELIRAEIMLEQATLFLHLSYETNSWPFSVRNETDVEFLFFQAVSRLSDAPMALLIT
jgi:vacuolar protein sorting-associated protein 13A/C